MQLPPGLEARASQLVAFGRQRSRHFDDRLAAGLVLVVSSCLLLISLTYGLHGAGDQVGAGFFPSIVSGGVVALSILWMIQGAGPQEPKGIEQHGFAGIEASLMEEKPEQWTPLVDVEEAVQLAHQVDADDGLSEDPDFDRAGLLRMAFVVAWSGITLSFMNRLGVIVVMTVYLTGLLTVVARRKLVRSLIWSFIGCAGGAYGAYRLGIVLPDPLHILDSVTG